jgi:endonuclease YncB( thermonuclease family)
MKKIYSLIISILITILILIDLFYFTQLSNENKLETVTIFKVIDGDTLSLIDNRIIRLININSPEKGFFGSEESKSFLKSFENKSVKISITGRDQYSRYLARIYLFNKLYLNLEIVKEGLASKFLVDDSELRIFSNAEKLAIIEEKGIWHRSPYFNCFKIKIDQYLEVVRIENICAFVNLNNWIIKDESRKIYIFKDILIGEINLHTHMGINNKTDVYWNSNQKVWNNDRDSLYLFDEKGRIAAYEVYGY